MTFLIAAAGTGGHVFPGLAVGGLLALGIPKNRSCSSGVTVWRDRLSTGGFPFLEVKVRGLQRSMTMPA